MARRRLRAAARCRAVLPPLSCRLHCPTCPAHVRHVAARLPQRLHHVRRVAHHQPVWRPAKTETRERLSTVRTHTWDRPCIGAVLCSPAHHRAFAERQRPCTGCRQTPGHGSAPRASAAAPPRQGPRCRGGCIPADRHADSGGSVGAGLRLRGVYRGAAGRCAWLAGVAGVLSHACTACLAPTRTCSSDMPSHRPSSCWEGSGEGPWPGLGDTVATASSAVRAAEGC
jgi:hypothetical protein